MGFWKWLTEPEPKNCFVCDYCNRKSDGVAFCFTCLGKIPKGVYYSDTGFHCKPSIVEQGRYIHSLNKRKLSIKEKEIGSETMSKYYDSNGHTLAGIKEYIELKQKTDELIDPHILGEIIKQFEYDYKLRELEYTVASIDKSMNKTRYQKYEINEYSSKKDTSKLEILKKYFENNG